MSNYIMSIDFLGTPVRAETSGVVVSLNDLVLAGNAYRTGKGQAVFQLAAFINAKGTQEYIEAASEVWGVPKEKLLYKVGKGKYTRTMAHISVAILAAEQISPRFHAQVHKTFIEGKLLEFRELGGTEFRVLNACIDQHLPGREGKKSNQGVFIQVAKRLRAKLLGAEATAEDWAKASVAQIHSRYEAENKLSEILRLGLVRDYQHLIELIDRV